MRKLLSPLQEARDRQRSDPSGAEWLLSDALRKTNRNAGRNTYLSLDEAQHAANLSRLMRREANSTAALLGIPVSIKDCFDLQGFHTSCGSRFYGENNPLPKSDSWIVAQVQQAGGVIIGKTHMQQLAYGITGENADFGNCIQPDDATLLTGGSSSGAAASVQEGSALVAIGTDTGGSIRVPAALCSLVGYRSSIGAGSWHGGSHLAPSFDTLGLLFRDSRDGPELAKELLGIGGSVDDLRRDRPRVAIVGEEFLYDCDAEVRDAFALQKEQLFESGAELVVIETDFWANSLEIFAAIQAHEAAAIQRLKLAGRADFSVFEPQIADRLAWGESLSPAHVNQMRERHVAFRASMDLILAEFNYLLLPCSPMHQLRADADHSRTRQQILRYTTPVSLAGMPAVTLPQSGGTGMQLVSARGHDASLLAYAAGLAPIISA
jgi:Asp-tRNA(Asn)/Glu-tRNA(Gln) amidotransferase A subunit family amidase